MNLISAMRSLLNIAALRSRTVPLLACQLGSAVSVPLLVTRAKLVAERVAAVAAAAPPVAALAKCWWLLDGN